MAKPIFLDPERKRWRRVRTISDLAGIAITLVIIVFVYSVVRLGQLPDLLLPEQHKPYRALREHERASKKEQAAKRAQKRRKKPAVAPWAKPSLAMACAPPIT